MRPGGLASCCLVASLALGGCKSSKLADGAGGAAPLGGGAGAADGSEGTKKTPSPSALSAQERSQLTTLLVSAHVGNVLARREPHGWVISGADGCAVSSARVERALDNLSALRAVPTTEAVPDGAQFRLQISTLVGEKRVVHLELAESDGRSYLTRLDDDSMVRIHGLDTELWSPRPADWCRKP